jgi:hypothetical protein
MRVLPGALLAVATLLSTAEARAFCRTTTVATDPSFSPTNGQCWNEGIYVYHSRKCVGYSIESPGSKKLDMTRFKELTETAFATWETSVCASGTTPSIDAQYVGDMPRSMLGYDTSGGKNASVIVFYDDAWPKGSTNEVILTTLTFNKESGEILDADMEVNTAEIDFALSDPVPKDGTDMQSALTHEVGHFFGLAHTSERTATMFARYTPGSTFFRDLSSDDVSGLCSVYIDGDQRTTSKGTVAGGACDPSAPPAPVASSEGGCSSVDGAADRGLGLAAPLAIALGVVASRRRRRPLPR